MSFEIYVFICSTVSTSFHDTQIVSLFFICSGPLLFNRMSFLPRFVFYIFSTDLKVAHFKTDDGLSIFAVTLHLSEIIKLSLIHI